VDEVDFLACDSAAKAVGVILLIVKMSDVLRDCQRTGAAGGPAVDGVAAACAERPFFSGT
jgi:hypothetical protein